MSIDKELADVKETTISWKYRKNQRFKTLGFLIKNENRWITPDDLRESLPEIKAPSTVLYDMALRNPDYTQRGQGYYDRQRVYPQGYSAKPILEYDENLGYRIRPEYYMTVRRNI